MSTVSITMTPDSKRALDMIEASGDMKSAVYALARTMGILDGVGLALEQAGVPPRNRDTIPEKVEDVLAGLALTKRWLLEIGAAVAKIDEAQKFLKLAMADPEGGSTGAVRDGHDWVKSATAELVSLCRGYAAGVSDDGD